MAHSPSWPAIKPLCSSLLFSLVTIISAMSSRGNLLTFGNFVIVVVCERIIKYHATLFLHCLEDDSKVRADIENQHLTSE